MRVAGPVDVPRSSASRLSAPGPDASLADVLAWRARHATDARLVLDVCVGLAVALGFTAWRPQGWIVLGSIGLALAAFGAWGITDRELGERSAGPGSAALTAARAAAAIVGVLAALLAAFRILATTLGTWIS